MPIFHAKKVLFLHNPKTGGTTIEKLFDLDRTAENLYNIGSSYQRGSNCALQHLSYIGMKERVPLDIFNSYYKFTFVRNPWDRLVSTYFWNHRGFATFEEFVKFVDMLYSKYTVETLTQYPEFTRKYCAHLYPQHIYTGDNVDVYRYENFATDLQKILRRFTIDKPIPVANISGHAHYTTYYNEVTRELVQKIYADDIRRFGYTFGESNILESSHPISVLTMMAMPRYTTPLVEKNLEIPLPIVTPVSTPNPIVTQKPIVTPVRPPYMPTIYPEITFAWKNRSPKEPRRKSSESTKRKHKKDKNKYKHKHKHKHK